MLIMIKVKVVSASFLHCKVTVFSFVLNNKCNFFSNHSFIINTFLLWGGTLKLQISCMSYISQANFCISGSCWLPLLLWCLLNDDFVSFIPSILTGFLLRKNCPFFSIYYPIYLHGFIDILLFGLKFNTLLLKSFQLWLLRTLSNLLVSFLQCPHHFVNSNLLSSTTRCFRCISVFPLYTSHIHNQSFLQGGHVHLIGEWYLETKI